MSGHTKESIKDRTRQCLERLSTDYVDCLQIHLVPTVEQIRQEAFHAAFHELKAEGRVRFLGLSGHGNQYGEAAALTMVSLIPALAIGILIQRHLVRGLTLGAVQG